MSSFSLSIEELKRRAASDPGRTAIRAQIDGVVEKRTREQKPYIEILLRDLTASFVLRVWSDHPFYLQSRELRAGFFVEIEGEFSINSAFGLEARNWTMRLLTAAIPFAIRVCALYRQCFSTNLETACGERPARETIITHGVADWLNMWPR
jgi:hypothetical protein